MFKTAGSFTPAAPVQSMPQKAGTVKAADFDRETSAPFRRGEWQGGKHYKAHATCKQSSSMW